jgi:hypothetical protein
MPLARVQMLCDVAVEIKEGRIRTFLFRTTLHNMDSIDKRVADWLRLECVGHSRLSTSQNDSRIIPQSKSIDSSRDRISPFCGRLQGAISSIIE